MDNEEKISERLDRIVDGMDKLVDGMDKLVEAIPKPASRIQRIFDALATFATVAGLLGIIQIIITWVGG
jgi:hypothetical protein